MPTSFRTADPIPPRKKLRQQGFALLIMLIIAVIGSLYAVTSQLEVASRKYSDATARALALAKEVLIGYAVTYRDDHSNDVFGYLPCPDIDGDGSGEALSADCGASDGKVVIGLLPFKQLGLPSNTDADGNCLWYAVSGTFKASSNGTYLPRPLNWDTQGQIEIRDSSDTLIAKPDDQYGGAAAVIFSAGPPQASQNNRLEKLDAVSCGVSAIDKANAIAIYSNYIEVDPLKLDPALSEPFPGPANGTVRVVQGVVGSTTNNDRLIWITPKEIFDRIVRRKDFSNALSASPAGQINYLSDQIKTALEKNIQADLTSGTTTASQPLTTGYTQYGKQIGKLPVSMTLNDATNYGNYYTSWAEQYRQVVCASLATPCLSVAGTTCRGALMFAGRTSNGQPRPSTQKIASTANLDYYFESGNGRDILNSPATTFFGTTAYSATSPSADVGTCLFPGDFTSLAHDVGSFTSVITSGFTPEAVIDAATHTITLGNPAAWAAGRGCVWYPTERTFNSLLRAYYKLNIANLGEGFVFAIVDGPSNQAAMADGTLCGSTTGARMGYTTASIDPPKFGLEIDTRLNTTADCSGSNRNDPDTHHMALVYWGTTGTTGDDNCHDAGTLGSGSQPLNPRTLTASAANVQSAAWAGNVATITTTAAHGMLANQQATIAGITPSQYNGNYQVAVIDATHLAYSLSSNPGAYVSGGTIATTVGIKSVQAGDTYLPYNGTLPLATDIHVRLDVAKSFDAIRIEAASWSANTVTVTTASPHGRLTNQRVTISGSNPAGYNGTYTITVTDSTHFTYPLGASPGSYLADGLIRPPTGVTVLTATRAAAGPGGAYTATIGTSSAHGFVTGQPVTVTGVSPAGYNGTYQIVNNVDASHFTYALSADPGAYISGGALTAAVALTFKAYVASTFPAGSIPGSPTCTAADFQDLSKDLSDFQCAKNLPQISPTLEQDNVYMNVNAATGKALSTIFAGFTNAQSSASSSEQTVTISNFIIRTQ